MSEFVDSGADYNTFLVRKSQIGEGSGFDLDVIEWCAILWSNPGEVVLTPFGGVGSEAYGAVELGRKAVLVELKPSYFRQAMKNMASVVPIEDQRESESLSFLNPSEC